MDIGIGAFKFQSVISNEMRISKDPEHKTRIRSQSRKSIQEKCKFQFQNSKKKIVHKQLDLEDKEKIKIETLEDEESSDSQDNQLKLIEQKKKKDTDFVLKVSDPSSSDSLDSELGMDLQQERKSNQSNFYEEENMLASQNLKTLTFTNNNTLQSQNTLQLNNNKQPQKYNQPNTKKQKIIKSFRPAIIKKDIQFLRGLKQNQDFINNDIATLEEYKIDREICVDMDCQDIQTFMRLQNEVEEMKRKQMDFNKQKERHYEIMKNKPKKLPTTVVKQEENKLWTVMMAKKFIKNMKLKKDAEPQLQSQQLNLQNVIRKNTRNSQVKANS